MFTKLIKKQLQAVLKIYGICKIEVLLLLINSRSAFNFEKQTQTCFWDYSLNLLIFKEAKTKTKKY